MAVALDRSVFEQTIDLVALRIPARKCTEFTKRFAGHIYHRPRVKPIVADAEAAPGAAATRLLLLSEAVSSLELAELPDELRSYALAEAAVPVRYALQLGFEHLSAEQALRRVLPAGIEVPSSFESVGHVAHVNLREDQLPYKALIGKVLLEKNGPRIRSVVNKVESITNVSGPSGQDEKAKIFRVFPMEVLAGEDSLRTTVRENGARFELDFRDVYWNSRLETEHKRIVDLLPADAVVADAFAGIGPFAVPAAMHGIPVYANDLNPRSHEFLQINVDLNKIGARVATYNLDARAFLRQLLAPPAAPRDGVGEMSGGGGSGGTPTPLRFGFFTHVLMNLPASALTFLDAFVGAFDRASWRAPLPMVHCYCFSKAADPCADVLQIAERTIGCKLPDATVHVVRDVSPHKLMLCVQFRVPDSVAWAADRGASSLSDEESERAKRQRTVADGVGTGGEAAPRENTP